MLTYVLPWFDLFTGPNGEGSSISLSMSAPALERLRGLLLGPRRRRNLEECDGNFLETIAAPYVSLCAHESLHMQRNAM